MQNQERVNQTIAKFYQSVSSFILEYGSGSDSIKQQLMSLPLLYIANSLESSHLKDFKFTECQDSIFGFIGELKFNFDDPTWDKLVESSSRAFSEKFGNTAHYDSVTEHVKTAIKETKLQEEDSTDAFFPNNVNTLFIQINESGFCLNDNSGEVFECFDLDEFEDEFEESEFEDDIGEIDEPFETFSYLDASDTPFSQFPECSTESLLNLELETASEFIEQLSWLSCASAMENKSLSANFGTLLNNSTGKSNESNYCKILSTIDSELFLAALIGSEKTLNIFSNLFNLPLHKIEFPVEIYKLRERLMNHVTKRTFKSELSGHSSSESNWFSIAETLTKDIVLDESISKFLSILFSDLGSLEKQHSIANFIHQERNSIQTVTNFWNLNDRQHNDFERINKINNYLYTTVIGQNAAVESITEDFSKVLIGKVGNTLGTSTFLGASGTGKTYSAEQIALAINQYTNLGYESYVLNMEQFNEEKDVLKLWGSGSQYVDSAMGDLTTIVAKNPRQIIVFDEIEKAHPKVIQSLLTLIDKGTGTDRTTNKIVSFSQCYFIFTSNLGADVLTKMQSEDLTLDTTTLLSNRSQANSLSPEFVNRLSAGSIVVFKELMAKDLIKLAITQSDKREETLIDWGDLCPEIIIKSLGSRATPRSIKTQLDKLESKIICAGIPYLQENSSTKCEKISIAANFDNSNFSGEYVLLTNGNYQYTNLSQFIPVEINNISDFERALQVEADGYVIDENHLDLNPLELSLLLRKYSQKTMYTFSTDESSLFSEENTVIAGIHRHFKISSFSEIQLHKLAKVLDRHSDLISVTNNNIKKRKQPSFEYHCTIENDNPVVSFKFGKARYALDQDDLKLPFLKFEGVPNISFKDVIGLDDIKNRFRIIIEGINNDSFLKSASINIPKGYILAGIPGTGKTLMAKALANECGVTFFNVNSADLLVGNVIDNINNLFDVLEKYSPTILNLDEIDAIAQDRTQSNPSMQAAVNTLLTRLDGFNTEQNKVFVLATTNHPEILDSALLRAGRLERTVVFNLPSNKQRKNHIKNILASKSYIISNKALERLCSHSNNYTIAKIEQLINESFLYAIENEKEWTEDTLLNHFKIESHGSRNIAPEMEEKEHKRVAYHEVGHLVTLKLLFPNVKISDISIEPTSEYLGAVSFDANDLRLATKKDIKNKLQVLLGGASAEQIYGLGDAYDSTGVYRDRKQATIIARQAIEKFGLSKKFGLCIPSELTISSDEVNIEVNLWLSEAHDGAVELLAKHKPLIDFIVDQLLIKKTLSSADIDKLFDEYSLKNQLQAAS